MTNRTTDLVVGVYALSKVIQPLDQTIKSATALNITANRLSKINNEQFRGLGDKLTTLGVTTAFLTEGLDTNIEGLNILAARMAYNGLNTDRLAQLTAGLQGVLALNNQELHDLSIITNKSSLKFGVTADKLLGGIEALSNQIGGMLTVMGTQSSVLKNTADIEARLGPQYIQSVNKLFSFAGSLEFDKWALLGDTARVGLQRLIEGTGDFQDFRAIVFGASNQLRKLGAFSNDVIGTRAVVDLLGADIPQALASLEEGIRRYDLGLRKATDTNVNYRVTVEAFVNQVLSPLAELGLAISPIVGGLTSVLTSFNGFLTSTVPDRIAAGITAGATIALGRGLLKPGALFSPAGFGKVLALGLKFSGIGALLGLALEWFIDDEPQKVEVANKSPIVVKTAEKLRTSDLLRPDAQIYGLKTTQAIEQVLNKIPLSDNMNQKMLQEMKEQNELLKQVIFTLKKNSITSMLEGK